MGDGWRDHKEFIRAKKEKRRDENTKIIEGVVARYEDKYDMGIHWITPYQARVFFEGGGFDFYPTSGKVCEKGSTNFFTPPSIEKYVKSKLSIT